MFTCGSFNPEEEDVKPYSTLCSSPKKSNPCSTPKGSRKNGILWRSKSSINPYANRGLDKFSALLADLEDKKKKIYTKKGAGNISFVRFVYSDSNHVKPIVVKLQKQEKTNVKEKHMNENSEVSDKHPVNSSTPANEVPQSKKDSAKKKSFNVNLGNWRRNSYYLPVVIILILMMLIVFGRSFVILCTCVGLYLVPSINKGNSAVRREKKNKEYAKRLSYQNRIMSGLSSSSPKLASPRSVITEPMKDKLPGQHCHQRSW